MLSSSLIIVLAVLVDALIGDPPRLPHPVRLIGRVIGRLETVLRRLLAYRLRLAGTILTGLVVGGTWVAGTAICQVAARFGSGWTALPAALVLVYLAATTIASRELLLRVREVLRCDDLDESRRLVSQLVGRDTDQLDADGIRRAALETLAENASDGIVAPLFYLGLGGLPLALAYKAINTLDSMVGYRNEKYAELGWAAAKLDDLANYLPARLTGLLIVIATWLLDGGKMARAQAAWRIMRRDGRNHASPNSAVPEAALAGAIGVRLGGPTSYFGRVREKPWIGDGLTAVSPGLANQALGIILLAAILAPPVAVGIDLALNAIWP